MRERDYELTCFFPFVHSLQCGHTYCCTCLERWFITIKSQYIQEHPEYLDISRQSAEPSLPSIIHRMLERDEFEDDSTRQMFWVASLPHLWAFYQQRIGSSRGRGTPAYTSPRYTCPMCRVRVSRAPAVDYKLAGIVKLVVEALCDDTKGDEIRHPHHSDQELLQVDWCQFFPWD